jgi:cell division protein FtsL
MKNLGQMAWVVYGIGAVALVSATLSIPVWKQNRYADLVKQQLELKKESLELLASIGKVDAEIRTLSSLSRIEPVAKSMGLGFHAVPTKVMEIPR